MRAVDLSQQTTLLGVQVLPSALGSRCMGLALSLACFLQRFLVREQCVLLVDIHAVLHRVRRKGCVISKSQYFLCSVLETAEGFSFHFCRSGNGRRVQFSLLPVLETAEGLFFHFCRFWKRPKGSFFEFL
jgi:hypothetical protein